MNEKEKLNNQQNQQLNIPISRSALNGFRPKVYISDDLEDLERSYTPKQLQKMWEDYYPKLSEISDKVIITGTPK